MKKLALLLLVSLLLASCSPSPQSIVNAWQDSLNKGDIDSTLALLADDAIVTIIPAGPDGDGIYNGQSEIRGWYETIVSGKGTGALSNCKTEGKTVACKSTYSDEGLKAMGVDFIEGDWVATLQNGKIQSYTFTITPDSLAKFPPPPEAVTEPTTVSTTEERIISAEKLTGNWKGKRGDYIVLHKFGANGSLVVSVSGIGVIGSGPYVFEGNLLKFEDSTGDCAGLIGRYEVYGLYEGEKLTQLRFVVNGQDPCSDRRKTLDGNSLTLD